MVNAPRHVRMNHRPQICASLLFLVIAISFPGPSHSLNPFWDATKRLMDENLAGVPAAFADVNADRRIDIFLIDTAARAVDVIIMAKEGKSKRRRLTAVPTTVAKTHKLVGVIPADYNGDSRVDVALVVGPRTGGGPVTVLVAYGTHNRLTLTAPKALPQTFTDQPALIDWNGDMIADLLGETAAGKTSVYMGMVNSTFREEAYSGNAWAHPAFTGFVDVNNDNQPDVFLTTTQSGKTGFEVILKDPNTNAYKPSSTEKIALPAVTLSVVGGPVFADFQLKGRMEMVLPACEDAKCSKSVLYVYSFLLKKWTPGHANFQVGSESWGFVPSSANPLGQFLPAPVTVRTGDVNGDGHPDLVAVLRRLPGPGPAPVEERRVGILLGRGNNHWELRFPLPSPDNVTVSGLFDFRATGRLGLVEALGNEPHLRAVMQGNVDDAYFLKSNFIDFNGLMVMVLNGRCSGMSDCPEHRTPYGLPVPGPSYTYNTERPEGGRQRSTAGQLTQTSYLALQSPFHVFGLGSFANYIEELMVYLPGRRGGTVKREKSFTFIVPKTQLVVIPFPLDQPAQWKSKLFLEPFKDKKVLFVAVALLGTIVGVAIIVGILQWRERREDIQEKLQEAQKFHFDAM